MSNIHPIVHAWRQIIKNSDICCFCGEQNAKERHTIKGPLGIICEQCADHCIELFRYLGMAMFDDFEIFVEPEWRDTWEA